MHVALTVDPEIPVPPELYGGIERIVDLLARGLSDRGHEVTLLAHPDSDTAGRLRPYPGRQSRDLWDTVQNTLHVGQLAFNAPDVVHSFGRLGYLIPLLPLHIPKIMAYHREPTPNRIQWGYRLARRNTLVFTGCSDYITAEIQPHAPAFTVYNGVPLALYDFQEDVSSEAPLVFLGRVEYMKGIDVALETALESGRRLIIAGNVPEDGEREAYFQNHVKPHVDGHQIQYIGPVDDKQKNELLGRAAALLMPSRYSEAFGLVIAEAMACGTPSIGLPSGAVSEVIDHGETGFVEESVDGFVEAVQRVNQIDRRECRRQCERRFSDEALVENYVQLYSAHVDGAAVQAT